MEDVDWDNEKIHGICFVLTPKVLYLLIPQFLITRENNIIGGRQIEWLGDDGRVFSQCSRKDVRMPSTTPKRRRRGMLTRIFFSQCTSG